MLTTKEPRAAWGENMSTYEREPHCAGIAPSTARRERS